MLYFLFLYSFLLTTNTIHLSFQSDNKKYILKNLSNEISEKNFLLDFYDKNDKEGFASGPKDLMKLNKNIDGGIIYVIIKELETNHICASIGFSYLNNNNKIGWIDSLLVGEEYRGQSKKNIHTKSFGITCLTFAEKYFKGNDCSSIQLITFSKKAENFYRNNGFSGSMFLEKEINK